MIPIEIYTTRYCPYCHAAKRLLSHKGAKFTEIDVSGDPKGRSDMVSTRERRGRPCRRSSSARPMSAATTISPRSTRPASSIRCSAAAMGMAGADDARPTNEGLRHEHRNAASFTAGLVQMRSGLSPQANLDAAVRLIGEAKSAGADYVQTPEMTNILEVKRERLFAAIAPEESDVSLATFRELARKLGIFLHVGSLAIKLLPEKAANRSFLIDRKGDIVARYDKIHMFDVDLAGGESYRESRNYRPGEIGVATDLPWGRLGLTVCYDLRFPSLYRALAEAGCSFLAIPSAFTRQTGEAHWHVLEPRPRDRERRLRAGRRRRAARTRTAARPSAIPSWSIRGAASWPKAAPSRA